MSKKHKNNDKKEEEKTLIFQDVVNDAVIKKSDAEALSLAFFELANVPIVGYRLNNNNDNNNKTTTTITVRQDLGCTTHTGGIVWETSYLLLNYLLQQQDNILLKKKGCRILEVGAGCGLLGQVLAAASSSSAQVVMTECDIVMHNLQSNLERNTKVCSKKNDKPNVVACTLDWLDYKKKKQQPKASSFLQPHSFDLIVGTDVVFCTDLVKPLLKTLRYYSVRDAVVVYLCLQVRCEDSHELLLNLAPKYGWTVSTVDLSSESCCAWGLQLECILLKLTRNTSNSSSCEEEPTITKKEKKRKASHCEEKSRKKKRKKHA